MSCTLHDEGDFRTAFAEAPPTGNANRDRSAPVALPTLRRPLAGIYLVRGYPQSKVGGERDKVERGGTTKKSYHRLVRGIAPGLTPGHRS
jgi:hypothetical protein